MNLRLKIKHWMMPRPSWKYKRSKDGTISKSTRGKVVWFRGSRSSC
jgi:hypothetical protein